MYLLRKIRKSLLKIHWYGKSCLFNASFTLSRHQEEEKKKSCRFEKTTIGQYACASLHSGAREINSGFWLKQNKEEKQQFRKHNEHENWMDRKPGNRSGIHFKFLLHLPVLLFVFVLIQFEKRFFSYKTLINGDSQITSAHNERKKSELLNGLTTHI